MKYLQLLVNFKIFYFIVNSTILIFCFLYKYLSNFVDTGKDIIKEGETELNLLEELKKELINYLDTKHKQLQDFKKTFDVYNILTLEVIKVILMMLKFGLFSNKPIPEESQSPEIGLVKKKSKSPEKSPNTNTFKQKFNMFLGFKENVGKSEIEKIVEVLAVFLEYDEAYYEALKDLEIKRSNFIDNSNSTL